MASNLPQTTSIDSSTEVRQFFDKYYLTPISFPSNQIDAVVGFFLKHGFEPESARSTGIVLLNQAKADNIDVFQLIDSLSSLSDVQLSQVVAQILNAYRENTSVLGYRVRPIEDEFESRSILV